jgi:hypothetical protein
MARFIKNSTKEMKPRFYGMMQTVWSGTDQFIDAFYGKQQANAGGRSNPADAFKALFSKMDEVGKVN